MRRIQYTTWLTLSVMVSPGCVREGLERVEETPPDEVWVPAPAPAEEGTDLWAPMAWAHERPDGYDSDVYRWEDSGGHPRVAVLTRNDVSDPGGSHGGMLRRFRFHVGDQERVATGTGANGLWNGWGYVVSHYNEGEAVSHSALLRGTWRQVFLGQHHVLHEFSWDLPIGGVPIRATVQWFFATGKDHPVYAVTFDSRAAGPEGLMTNADSRAPYGDIAWDGDGTQAWVDGVRWGDKYRFFSRAEPLTASSAWDYSEPNVVPYASVYSRTADAEMGVVQTLDWLQHNTGGSWFHDNWGHVSETRVHGDMFRDWMMPPSWNWPYQLCQYELDTLHPTRSKRLAWGLMYGAVGKTTYSGYGMDRVLTGHPYQSYSVFMIMGRWSEKPVLAQVAQVERLLQARLRVSHGSVVAEGPGGVARTDTVRYAVSGYNSTYGALEIQTDLPEGFSVSLDAAGGDILNPLFLVHGMKAPLRRLSLDGMPLRADLDYFASFDARTGTVWLTLSRQWRGQHTLAGSSRDG
ncbi:hypothetical protein [Melittangium boletus]|uniref:Uncharacterized protein n=1 Tax=Melittangium boletus DSM 14713 TaxID=1294270 RepID=A0A286NVB3_9BACT|nr:hypothetical protein [Melittangium boletus]ATB27056.1 hypothetical protein MEBOL_000491 [Melittangium boletus DSM 14713]